MREPTARGDDLAARIMPAFGPNVNTYQVRSVCADIAAKAVTYHRLMENDCNGYPDDAMAERVRARIGSLVDALPRVANIWTNDPAYLQVVPVFGGDPRGCVVSLRFPGQWERLHDGWDRDRGVIVR